MKTIWGGVYNLYRGMIQRCSQPACGCSSCGGVGEISSDSGEGGGGGWGVSDSGGRRYNRTIPSSRRIDKTAITDPS